jgi:hypothetical protein
METIENKPSTENYEFYLDDNDVEMGQGNPNQTATSHRS